MKIGGVALILSSIPLGVGVFALTREDPPPVRAPMRVDNRIEISVVAERYGMILTGLGARVAQPAGSA